MFSHLKVYAGSNHPHEAQLPKKLEIFLRLKIYSTEFISLNLNLIMEKLKLKN